MVLQRYPNSYEVIYLQALRPPDASILAHNADGSGGEWYSRLSHPDAAIICPVRARRVTAREVQEHLDAAGIATDAPS
jgi:hypothetical protein